MIALVGHLGASFILVEFPRFSSVAFNLRSVPKIANKGGVAETEQHRERLLGHDTVFSIHPMCDLPGRVCRMLPARQAAD